MVDNRVDVAEVRLWDRTIGAVYWDDKALHAVYEYTAQFQQSGIEVAPLMMPLRPGNFRFPALARTSFKGLPGLLADSLPDDFGNAIIDQWLIREGRAKGSFSPVERLCYIGRRGMGALEFRPAMRNMPRGAVKVEIEHLVELAQHVLDLRDGLQIRLSGKDADYARALDDILRVGTSAGGARAKAVIAWNRDSNEIRSGQLNAPDGFEYWILKFDGVQNRERGIRDPQGYGCIEYAYYLMAQAAGIDMSECRLLEENGRSHFMTKRFDREDNGAKLHMQSLYAIGHLDNQLPGAHSYEQAMQIMQSLRMPATDLQQQYRRMLFNVLARNQDDHSKNIAYLMDKQGRWRLSPAFDVIYAWNPDGAWTSRHQMSINGKLDDFDLDDIEAVAKRFSIRNRKDILEEVTTAVAGWRDFAEAAGIPAASANSIAAGHRLLSR